MELFERNFPRIIVDLAGFEKIEIVDGLFPKLKFLHFAANC